MPTLHQVATIPFQMLPSKLAFVDLETTGTNSRRDRIIEVGVVLVDDGKVSKTFSSLINPQSYIAPIIENITGITRNDLETAPIFETIADSLLELLDERIFVAHNVRFDYGFLKSEFKRIRREYSSKHFCTVRLSRTLFPQLPRHNLDTIISHFNIPVAMRHRALDDAKAIQEFYQKAKKQVGEELFISAVEKVLKKPYLPSKLSGELLDNLPESAGVYLFYGDNDLPLYIGKSINIKERVLSHFSTDIHNPLEMKITQQITRIETIKTAGELGALFLESHLIKNKLPLYNRMLRNSQTLVLLKKSQNNKGYCTTILETLTNSPLPHTQDIIGIFRSQKQAKEFQTKLCATYMLCEKLLGMEKTGGACFGYRLEKCKGACTEKEDPLRYNMRFIQAVTGTQFRPWPYKGPIIITEYDEFEEKQDFFLVDNWCLLGKVQTDSNDAYLDEEYPYSFDLDTYKILSRHLLSRKKITIKEVPRSQIAA